MELLRSISSNANLIARRLFFIIKVFSKRVSCVTMGKTRSSDKTFMESILNAAVTVPRSNWPKKLMAKFRSWTRSWLRLRPSVTPPMRNLTKKRLRLRSGLPRWYRGKRTFSRPSRRVSPVRQKSRRFKSLSGAPAKPA